MINSVFTCMITRSFFWGSFVLFMSCVCHAFVSVHCCLVVTCWERTDLLSLFCDVKLCFVTVSCGILGQVWYLIVSISDICHLSYFAIYSKTCVKRPLKMKIKDWFSRLIRINAGQKYCRMLQESILQYFRPSLSYHLSLSPLFCLFLSGRSRQVLL